jgi:cob(I)alamin adenosyltransferase
VRITTKGGDSGETGLFDGARVSKTDPRVRACGDVDELNATIGVARASLAGIGNLVDVDAALARIQDDLFALGAVLADPRRDEGREPGSWTKQVSFDADRTAFLDRQGDAWEETLPVLQRFILPGGSPQSSALHVCRAVARRAEREVVALREQGGGTAEAVIYLNRLSDVLFVAARLANARQCIEDITWSA